jgi:hypothetical protein
MNKLTVNAFIMITQVSLISCFKAAKMTRWAYPDILQLFVYFRHCYDKTRQTRNKSTCN